MYQNPTEDQATQTLFIKQSEEQKELDKSREKMFEDL